MHCKDKESIMKRRAFIKHTALGTSLFPFLGLGSFLGAAETDGEYKAIVVVLLEGGADVFNMLAPTNEDYAAYAAARGNIALSKESLLDIGSGWGMRDNMTAMQQLYIEKKLAIVANVGTLIEPITAAQVETGSKPVPFELFAHNTQRAQWLFGDATGDTRSGWAARTADLFYPEVNPYANINMSDVNTNLQYGGSAEALRLQEASISPDTMKSYGFGPMSGGEELGNVYYDLYVGKQKNSHKLMQALSRKRVAKMDLPDEMEGVFDDADQTIHHFDNGVHEVGRPLGRQLEEVTKVLSVTKNGFKGSKRQVFFVNHHGWDTHDSDNEHQVGYLSKVLGEFQSELKRMGIEKNITTMTISDFGRSLSSNNAGTDHGWGSHAFVMGGAVKGGQLYGTMPKLSKTSSDFWSDRMVPATAVESYLATVVKWFGATKDELNTIFPNLKSFSVKDIGFMG
jgi:uncharacterized protein (DUF1501 family)